MLSAEAFLRSWANEDSSEAKTTMESNYDSFLHGREYVNHGSNLAELKPLEPLEFMSLSPENTLSIDASCNDSSPTLQYKGAIITNTFVGYSGTPEPVSTTTSPLSSSIIKQEESDNFVGAEDIDDLASMIGCANTDTSLPTQPMTFNEQIEPSLPESSLTIEDWLMLDVNKNELSDSVISSNMCGTELSSSEQPSTTTPVHTTSDYGLSHHHSIHQHVQQPIHSSLHALLTGSGVNSGSGSYLQGLTMPEDSYQKAQPILYNKLTQPQKDTLTNLNNNLLKTDPIFGRSNYYQNKDAVPHSTESVNYAVSTTDEILVTKFDPRYLEQTQLGSPDSDLSSTQLGYDYGEFKGKNRTRLARNPGTKLAIRTEGTKDKPIHHCTVCNRGFLNKSNIKVHLRTHTGEKPFRCETCNKAFRQKAHLLKHYQIHKRGARD